MPDWTVWILCVIFTLIWARIAALFANKATPKTLNRVTGVILVILGLVVMVILKACSPLSGAGEMVALSQQYRILPAVTCSIQEADPLTVSFF